MQPFVLEPAAVSQPWAGVSLREFLPADYLVRVESGRTGEWRMAGGEEGAGRIAGGALKGMSLDDLCRKNWREFMGLIPVLGSFPLSVRILDVAKPQPLMFYPLSTGLRSEMQATYWYSLGGQAGCEVTAGIRTRTTRAQLLARLGTSEARELLEVFPAPFGDSFLIMPGVVHSASAGSLLLEIHAGPMPPYRLGAACDEWAECVPEADGLSGLAVSARHLSRIRRDVTESLHTRRIPLVQHCPAFRVDEFRLRDYFVDRTGGRCCHLLCSVQGKFALECDGVSFEVSPGQVCCIPASCGDYRVLVVDDGCTLLRIIPGGG